MPTNVILIAGAGRSGTTFLSQLLSQNDDCANVGQIRHLPASMQRNRDCTCGKPLNVCPYWGGVAAKMVRAHGARALRDWNDGFSAFQRSCNGLKQWSDPDVRQTIAADHRVFIDMNADLYHFASEEAGNRTLIDSSKIPVLALALTLAGDVSLHTINLVRDPRAVAVSWAKVVKNSKTRENRCRNWNQRVNQMREIEGIPGQPFLRIAYEQFAAAPRAEVERIQTWAGLVTGTSFFTSDTSADISWDRTHLFPPANEEVLEKRATRIEIRPSDTWKLDRFAELRGVAEKINFPKAVQVGYSKSRL